MNTIGITNIFYKCNLWDLSAGDDADIMVRSNHVPRIGETVLIDAHDDLIVHGSYTVTSVRHYIEVKKGKTEAFGTPTITVCLNKLDGSSYLAVSSKL